MAFFAKTTVLIGKNDTKSRHLTNDNMLNRFYVMQNSGSLTKTQRSIKTNPVTL